MADASLPRPARHLPDAEWFHSFCDLLTRDHQPTFASLCQVLGTPQPGSGEHLQPADPRFSGITICRAAIGSSTPLVRIGLHGPPFSLPVGVLLARFPRHRLKHNTYDGGQQIFLHPIPGRYAFSALSAWTDSEVVTDVAAVVVDNVQFQFGDVIAEFRDGFWMQSGGGGSAPA